MTRKEQVAINTILSCFLVLMEFIIRLKKAVAIAK